MKEIWCQQTLQSGVCCGAFDDVREWHVDPWSRRFSRVASSRIVSSRVVIEGVGQLLNQSDVLFGVFQAGF